MVEQKKIQTPDAVLAPVATKEQKKILLKNKNKNFDPYQTGFHDLSINNPDF